MSPTREIVFLNALRGCSEDKRYTVIKSSITELYVTKHIYQTELCINENSLMDTVKWLYNADS
jgi:hypothetical protein